MHLGKHYSKAVYFDRLCNALAVKLLPGQYHASDDGAIITTVLGSCVSVCLYDSRGGIGGMNHFMLPGEVQAKGGGQGSARYGVHAMDLLLEHILQLGAQRHALEAKVFGAGKVMDGMSDVGARNSEFALRYLKEKDIRLRALDVGSTFPRKVYFFPATGRALVKKFRKQELSPELLLSLDAEREPGQP